MTNGMDEVKRDCERGCPQESICGHSVWNLGMNNLTFLLESMGIKVIAFADDFVVIVIANS